MRGQDPNGELYDARFSTKELHSRMPLVPMPARVKLFYACDQLHSSRVVTFLSVHTVTPSEHERHKEHDISSLETMFLAGERSDTNTIDHYIKMLGVNCVDHWCAVTAFVRSDLCDQLCVISPCDQLYATSYI
jgi:hypothetical protein